MKVITKAILIVSLSAATVFGSSAVLANSANEIKATEFEPVQQTSVSDGPIFGQTACENYPLC
ncbi:MAG: hypothetical protein HRT35_08890 [Algicola sp.]|nr:hypothetical protein [Algicola sp.]